MGEYGHAERQMRRRTTGLMIKNFKRLFEEDEELTTFFTVFPYLNDL